MTRNLRKLGKTTSAELSISCLTFCKFPESELQGKLFTLNNVYKDQVSIAEKNRFL